MLQRNNGKKIKKCCTYSLQQRISYKFFPTEKATNNCTDDPISTTNQLIEQKSKIKKNAQREYDVLEQKEILS